MYLYRPLGVKETFDAVDVFIGLSGALGATAVLGAATEVELSGFKMLLEDPTEEVFAGAGD